MLKKLTTLFLLLSLLVPFAVTAQAQPAPVNGFVPLEHGGPRPKPTPTPDPRGPKPKPGPRDGGDDN
ncbi:MAG: hypothetical protein M3347_09345 [Armatimonadota bacterium]|nr:hypothetical protein [Armatimonadota bacterium]